MKSSTLIPVVILLISAILMLVGCSMPININVTGDTSDASIAEVLNAPSYNLPSDKFSVAMNQYRDYLVLINADHPYAFDGVYDTLLQEDIIYLSDVYGDPTPVEKAAACAFTELQYALKDKGVEIGLLSAYRTMSDQEWVVKNYRKPDWQVADPGYTEHHTGLLVDILVKWPDPETGDYIWMTETLERSEKFAESSKVLHRTLADYGFIDRFPVGKEEVTGIMAMPNEIRFVGSSRVAHEIMDSGLTLEEYLESHSANKNQ